jgi:hypothetical protein
MLSLSSGYGNPTVHKELRKYILKIKKLQVAEIYVYGYAEASPHVVDYTHVLQR